MVGEGVPSLAGVIAFIFPLLQVNTESVFRPILDRVIEEPLKLCRRHRFRRTEKNQFGTQGLLYGS